MENTRRNLQSLSDEMAAAQKRVAAAGGELQAQDAQDQARQEQLRQLEAAKARLTAQREERLRAQLAVPYDKWLSEDVTYIITPQEKAEFQQLQTNQQREQFIEQFWLNRDPTPGTVTNEFKEEHYRRIAYANEHFAESIPGWKTHRGMYYIKFGPPDEIEQHMDSHPRFIAWTYRLLNGAPATLVFSDVDGSGLFTLPRHNEAQRIIMGTPPQSPRVEISGDTVEVTLNIPSSGGPTTVYLRVETLAGATVQTLRAPMATPPSFTFTWRMAPGTYRIQGFVQRPGESVFALYPRGEQFMISAPAQPQAAAARKRVDTDVQTSGPQLAAAGQAMPRVNEVMRRTGYANSAFAEGAVPGAQTARGRIYMQYGPPDSIDVRGSRQVWTYRQIDGIGKNITVEFNQVGASWVGERPTPYVIGAQDRLGIMVRGQPAFTAISYLVRPDGMISVPMLGEVAAGGKTVQQLSTEITERLAKYVRDPQVTATVLQIAQ